MRIRSEYLRELRLRFGKTQQQIAEEAGVDIRTYRKYETGEVGNSAEKSLKASQYEFLRNIAAVYDLEGGPDELLHSEEPAPLPQSGDLPTSTLFTALRYVHRPKEEAQALRRIERAGTPVLIQAPERFGSTRFVGYLLSQVSPAGPSGPGGPAALSIRCNLKRLLRTVVASGRPLLQALAEHILQRTYREPEALEHRLRALRALPATDRSRLSWVLEQHVLPRPQRTVLTLEHADAELSPEGRDELFGLLRSWMSVCTRPPWDRLRLVLTLSTESMLLTPSEPSSFLSAAAPIRLTEFSPEQMQELALLEGLPRSASLSRLRHYIGGHPFLLRLAIQAAVEREADLDQLLDDPETRQAIYEHHLLHLRRDLEERPGMLARLCELARKGTLRLPLTDYCLLHSKGLVVERSPGQASMRCPLYAEYFAQLGGDAIAPVPTELSGGAA